MLDRMNWSHSKKWRKSTIWMSSKSFVLVSYNPINHWSSRAISKIRSYDDFVPYYHQFIEQMASLLGKFFILLSNHHWSNFSLQKFPKAMKSCQQLKHWNYSLMVLHHRILIHYIVLHRSIPRKISWRNRKSREYFHRNPMNNSFSMIPNKLQQEATVEMFKRTSSLCVCVYLDL